MNTFTPYVNMYYQFWMVPNATGNEAQYYNTIIMYPQFVQPQPSIPTDIVPEVESTANLPEIKPKTEEITESKPTKTGPQEKVEP